MKKYASIKISYLLVSFFLGMLVLFFCSIFGAVHAVSMAAAEAESKPVIILDAGHGGEDGGAVSANGAMEKNINLQIALYVQEALQHAGYPVVMVRDTDTAVGDTSLDTIAQRKRSDIQYRTQLVQETEQGILVSIHQNFFEQSQYSGAQVFYSPNHTDSAVLAESIRAQVVEQLQPENTRACKQAESNIYLLSHVDVPAVIVECGFLSNPEEAELLCDRAYQEKMAAAITDGIVSFCTSD